jgi:predicted DCC family thiol-disulfide oxidoreductase YuxK
VTGAHVVFYDGVCGLCDRFVTFIIRRDRARQFRFAALQSPFAAHTLGLRGIALAGPASSSGVSPASAGPGGGRGSPVPSPRSGEGQGEAATTLDTVYVLTADDRLLARSRAVLFVLAQLGGPWWVLSWARVVPAVIADRVYALVASVRYRLFGKRDACRLPSPEERALFLDDAVVEPGASVKPASATEA